MPGWRSDTTSHTLPHLIPEEETSMLLCLLAAAGFQGVVPSSVRCSETWRSPFYELVCLMTRVQCSSGYFLKTGQVAGACSFVASRGVLWSLTATKQSSASLCMGSMVGWGVCQPQRLTLSLQLGTFTTKFPILENCCPSQTPEKESYHLSTTFIYLISVITKNLSL